MLNMETALPAAPPGTVSVTLGVAATGCAAAAMATATLWLAVPVLALALTGFALGHAAHTRALADTRVPARPALAGQLLNIAALALIPCWGLVLVTMAAV